MTASGPPENMMAGPPGTLATAMALQEARAVLWLRNYPKPLGQLVDQGYLDRQRLAWAALQACDPKLKSAARPLHGSIAWSCQATPGRGASLVPAPESSAAGAVTQPTAPKSVEDGGLAPVFPRPIAAWRMCSAILFRFSV